MCPSTGGAKTRCAEYLLNREAFIILLKIAVLFLLSVLQWKDHHHHHHHHCCSFTNTHTLTLMDSFCAKTTTLTPFPRQGCCSILTQCPAIRDTTC